MNWQNKIVVITGAANGIGGAVANLLAQAGARVFCFDIKKPKHKVEGVTYLKVDVTKGMQVKKALQRIKGKIDILFNNAGVMKRGDILDVTEKDFELLFDVHIKGSWLMLKHAKKKLVNDAVIIQMSSRHALYFPSDPGLYALVKRTSLNLAELIELTYPSYNVKVLCPGPVDTMLSRTECDNNNWNKKKKMMCEPSFLAEKIIELIKSNKKKLIFDEKDCDYYFE